MPAAESPPQVVRVAWGLLCILTVAFVVSQSVAVAQSPVIAAPDEPAAQSISGILLDPSGAAIPKAEVTLTGSKAEVLASTITDAAGAFRIDHIPAGKYTLNFRADGFRETHITAAVTSKKSSPLRIVMQ